MNPLALLIVYCLLILLASLAGGWIPLWVRLTHSRMELASSFVAGLMLGVGLLHMLPHAVEELGSDGSFDQIMYCLLAGFFIMFFIERFFCFHHHEFPEATADGDETRDEQQHHHAHGHDHQLTWSGAAVGLSLHSVIAGIALAASLAAEEEHAGALVALPALGTFLVIFLHKPFDSLTLGTLMAKGGWTPKSRHLVNTLFALAIPVGAVLFHIGLKQGATGSPWLAWALAFSAGTFTFRDTLTVLIGVLLAHIDYSRSFYPKWILKKGLRFFR